MCSFLNPVYGWNWPSLERFEVCSIQCWISLKLRVRLETLEYFDGSLLKVFWFSIVLMDMFCSVFKKFSLHEKCRKFCVFCEI